MATNKHIEEAAHTKATTRTDIDEWQFGLLTDNADTNAPSGQQNAPVWANANAASIFVGAVSKVIDPSTGTERYLEVEFKEIYAADNVYVGQYIAHIGDSNTWFAFDTDKISADIGGVTFFDMVEQAGQDYVQWNTGQTDIDFRWDTSGQTYAMFLQGNDGFLGLHQSTPASLLHLYRDNADDCTAVDGAMLILEQDAATGDCGIQFEQTGVQTWSLYHDPNDDQESMIMYDITNSRAVTKWTVDGSFHLYGDGDATGRLGIGQWDTAPAYEIDIRTATPAVSLRNTTHGDGDGDRACLIWFRGEQSGGEDTTLAAIQASHDGTSDDQKGDLIFYTNAGSDDPSPTERMRIDSAGNIGIGTDSPDRDVHVKRSSAEAVIQIESGNNNAYLILSADSGNTASNADQDPRIYFRSATTTRACVYYDESSSQLAIGGDDDEDQFIFDITDNEFVIKGDGGDKRVQIQASDVSPHFRIKTTDGEDIGFYDDTDLNMAILNGGLIRWPQIQDHTANDDNITPTSTMVRLTNSSGSTKTVTLTGGTSGDIAILKADDDNGDDVGVYGTAGVGVYKVLEPGFAVIAMNQNGEWGLCL